MTRAFFPRRTVHLDFHTGPEVPNVGAEFDPDVFADTFAAAGVDSVTVFAKCHHGHLYYDTDRPERHPNLTPGLDLLEKQVDALHARGIKAPIYLSVQCDEFAANTHPEWLAMNGLEQVKFGNGRFAAGWQILDMSSPYQDYLADQVQEVIDRFAPLDGLFLDMCWDQPSTSVWATRAMWERGMDPASADDRSLYARQVAQEYMSRFQAMVEPHLDPSVASGVWFNSRPKTALDEEQRFLRHFEIEALPSGGWGYSFFPYTARFVRRLGKPTLSHTGRFHKSWGDNGGLKPHAALLYETSQILSQGMTAGVGDLLAPSGKPSAAVYDLVGRVYGHLQACEPFVENGEVVTEAALVVDPELGDTPGPSAIGALRALQQLRVQFDIIPPDADLTAYSLVVVPESTAISGELATNLSARERAGGATLISRSGDVHLEDDHGLLSSWGFALGDPLEYSHVFLRAVQGGGSLEGFDHVVYRRGRRLSVQDDGEVLAEVVAPYFERAWDRFSGHSYTPSSGQPFEGTAAIVRRRNTIVMGLPMLLSVALDGAPAYREMLKQCVDALLPTPLVRAAGPVHLETSVVRTPTSTVLHLISFVATRATEPAGPHDEEAGLDLVHDPFPIIDTDVQIRSERPVRAVRLQPSGVDLPHSVEDGFVRTRVTVLDGHQMVVVDH